MEAPDKVDVIIYRMRETGLEVFLVNGAEASELERWTALSGQTESARQVLNCIELDPVTGANGQSRKAIAIEADWHEIPSLRALLYEDYRVAKAKAKQRIKNLVPGVEKGAFFAVKEAFKRIMPDQYAYLKELKDILIEKNQTKYI